MVKDLLKELLSNRTLLLVVLLICVSYGLLVMLSASKNQKFALFLEKLFLVFVVFCLADIKISPFFHWHPLQLIKPPFSPILSKLQLVICAGMIFLLIARMKSFVKTKLIRIFQLAIVGNPFFWLVILMGFLSVFWSTSPLITFKAVLALAAINILAIYIVGQYKGQELFDIPMWSMAMIACMSFIIPKQDKAGHGLAGVLFSKNNLGTTMAIATVLWYLRATYKPQHRWLSWSITAISFILIPQSRSTGAWFLMITLFSFIILINFLKRLKFQYAVIGLVSFILISFATSILIALNGEAILAAFGKDLTFTGRTDVWSDYSRAVEERLWLGYGPYAFWQNWLGINSPAAKWDSGGWMPPHAHNGFFDISIDLGLIGLLLFSISFLVGIFQATFYLLKGRSYEVMLPMILLLFSFQLNISETRFFRFNLPWFLHVLAIVQLSVAWAADHNPQKKMSLLLPQNQEQTTIHDPSLGSQ